MDELIGDEGKTFTQKFDKPGTYGYYCEPHVGGGLSTILTAVSALPRARLAWSEGHGVIQRAAAADSIKHIALTEDAASLPLAARTVRSLEHCVFWLIWSDWSMLYTAFGPSGGRASITPAHF